MADAKALYQRHWKEFSTASKYYKQEENNNRAIIYAACIIAEAIRTEMDEADHTIPKE